LGVVFLTRLTTYFSSVSSIGATIAVALLDVSVGQNIFFAIKSSTVITFANANNIKFAKPNYKDLSNSELGNLITKATIYLECFMTVAKIKKIISESENRKAFFAEFRND